MVPDLKTILLSSTWNGTGAGDFHYFIPEYVSFCDTKLVLFSELGLARVSIAATRSPCASAATDTQLIS